MVRWCSILALVFSAAAVQAQEAERLRAREIRKERALGPRAAWAEEAPRARAPRRCRKTRWSSTTIWVPDTVLWARAPARLYPN